MPSKTLAAPLTDLVLAEVSTAWSRDKVLIGAGNLVVPGTVLAKNAAGDYNPVDFAGANGAQLAVAVSIETVDARTAAKKGMAVARGCVLDGAGLIWPVGASGPQKTGATGRLNDLGLVIRTAL